jgi:SAM-dependent methyltransferase
MSETSDELYDLYSSADSVRGKFSGDEQRASDYFKDYVTFVDRSVPAHNNLTLLDIGCGAGWSAYLFAKQGYLTMGIDLNEKAFEPPPTPGLTLQQASVLELPFADQSFNVVAAYQTIEHVPDPERALLEMLRVCKSGGMVSIVGPNLVGFVNSVKSVRNACKNRPANRIFFRNAEMPRHPFGNTLPEALLSVPVTFGRIVAKTLSPAQYFTMRRPDLRPPFHADNDACYMCNPIDLSRFFCQSWLSGNSGRCLRPSSLDGFARRWNMDNGSKTAGKMMPC